MANNNDAPGEPKKPKLKNEGRPGYREVFTPFITLKNGKILEAASCGKKVFHFWAKER